MCSIKIIFSSYSNFLLSHPSVEQIRVWGSHPSPYPLTKNTLRSSKDKQKNWAVALPTPPVKPIWPKRPVVPPGAGGQLLCCWRCCRGHPDSRWFLLQWLLESVRYCVSISAQRHSPSGFSFHLLCSLSLRCSSLHSPHSLELRCTLFHRTGSTFYDWVQIRCGQVLTGCCKDRWCNTCWWLRIWLFQSWLRIQHTVHPKRKFSGGHHQVLMFPHTKRFSVQHTDTLGSSKLFLCPRSFLILLVYTYSISG